MFTSTSPVRERCDTQSSAFQPFNSIKCEISTLPDLGEAIGAETEPRMKHESSTNTQVP